MRERDREIERFHVGLRVNDYFFHCVIYYINTIFNIVALFN